MSFMRVRTVITGAQGLPGLSTFYFNGTTASPSGADAADVVARVRAFWEAIKAYYPAGTSTQVSGAVDLLDPADGALTGSLAVTAPAVSNGSGSTPLPPATAMLLRHETGVIVAGRRLRGRSFISPLATAASLSGVVAPTVVSATNIAAAAMLTGATSSVPVVWHRPVAPGPSGGSVTATVSFATQTQFAVLRSRRD